MKSGHKAVRTAAVAWTVAAGMTMGGGAAPQPEWSGYYKHFVSLTDAHDNFKRAGLTSRDTLVDDIQRLRLQLDYGPWVGWEATVHYEARVAWGDSVRLRENARAAGAPGGLAGSAFFGSARARFMDLEGAPVEESKFILEHGLDRLRLHYRSDLFDLSVGRQAVSWGSGLIWTPSDLFTGFAPDEVDRDRKPGVDVVRLGVSPAVGGVRYDLVVEPLDTNRHYAVKGEDSSAALRATGHIGEYDLALLGGYVQSDYVFGGDFSGYLGDAGFRSDAVYTWVDESKEPNYLRAVVSADYSFAARWDPYLALEYFYNGLGTDDADRYLERRAEASVRRMFERGTAFNLGRDYLGALFRLAPSALLSLNSTTLWNLDDGSLLEFLTLSRSLSDNTELILGANVGIGPLGTEFGGLSERQAGIDFRNPDFYYAFLKTYF